MGTVWPVDYRACFYRGVSGVDRIQWGSMVPCDCEECYFYLNGLTRGVVHGNRKDVAIQYKCGKKMRTSKCSDINEMMNLGKGGSWCRMCYRMNKEGSSDEREKKCNTGRMDCPICNEIVCQSCWDMGYDKHKK